MIQATKGMCLLTTWQCRGIFRQVVLLILCDIAIHGINSLNNLFIYNFLFLCCFSSSLTYLRKSSIISHDSLISTIPSTLWRTTVLHLLRLSNLTIIWELQVQFCKMCKSIYIKYSCGCVGRFLGKEHCREDQETNALRERGVKSTDYRIIINDSLCGRNQSIGHSNINRKCHNCRRAEKNWGLAFDSF